MAADGGVDFQVRLINDVTRPAKAIQSAMKDVKKAFEQTKSAVEAPSPRRAAMSNWDKAAAKARQSQTRDVAREQAKIVKLTAAEHVKAQKAATRQAVIGEKTRLKEAKRIGDFKHGMAQQKLDQRSEVASGIGSAALGGVQMLAVAGIAAAAAIGYLAVKFGQAAVAAAAFGQTSRMALKFLTDSAGTGALQFDSLRHEAAGLGLDVERTQHSFQKLLAAQFEIGKARQLVRMGSDLQAIGASADDVEGVLLAITQIKSKGKLQAEEMLQLQERGISAELVYEALGKRLGKTKDELMALQKKGKLGGPDTIDAILDAVRKKTGTEFTGQAGEQFAKTTLTGMLGVWKGRAANFMIDVGDAILPGITKIAALGSSAITAIADNPKIAALGAFLVSEFEYFVLWAEANWPAITQTFASGAALMADTLRFTVELIDTNTYKGQAFVGMLGLLAVTLGVVALAGFTLMLPLYILIAVIGLVAFAIYKAITWVIDAVKSLLGITGGAPNPNRPPGTGDAKAGLFMTGGLANTPAAATVTTAAEAGPSARVGSALSGYQPTEQVTVASEQQGPGGTQNSFDFSGMQIAAGVDSDDLTAKIRAQVKKAVQEAA